MYSEYAKWEIEISLTLSAHSLHPVSYFLLPTIQIQLPHLPSSNKQYRKDGWFNIISGEWSFYLSFRRTSKTRDSDSSLFTVAKANIPAVLFFDEVDSLTRARSSEEASELWPTSKETATRAFQDISKRHVGINHGCHESALGHWFRLSEQVPEEDVLWPPESSFMPVWLVCTSALSNSVTDWRW